MRHRAVAIDPAAKTVTVESGGVRRAERYDKLLIATGAEPLKSPFPGAALPGVFTLRSIGDAEEIKRYISARGVTKAAVIGAGAIGLEVAEALDSRGIQVTVIEGASHPLPSFDAEMAAVITSKLRENGINVELDSRVKGIEETPRGLAVRLPHKSIETEMAILCAGVRPDTRLAKMAGIAVGANGCIIVDEHLKSSDENIYAVGDAVCVKNFVTGAPSFQPLAGPANREGRIAAENIMGGGAIYRGTLGSMVVKIFDLTAARTGISEREARAAGRDCGTAEVTYPSHAGYYPGAEDITMKLLFEYGSGEILGAQMTGGKGTDKRCDVIAAAMRFRATARDLTELELCYSPPYGTAADIVNIAGYIACTKLKER